MVQITLFPPFSNVLYFYNSTSHSMCNVPDMAVFCSYLMWYFPGMLFRYVLSYFEIVPVVPIAFVFLCLYTLYFCCKVFIFQNFVFFLSFFTTTLYDVLFIVKDGSVRFDFLCHNVVLLLLLLLRNRYSNSLRAGYPGIESRWKRDLPHLSISTWAHPASYPLGTGSVLDGVDHLPPSSTEDKEREELYL